jgi:hypothetical protein
LSISWKGFAMGSFSTLDLDPYVIHVNGVFKVNHSFDRDITIMMSDL